ncbi:MAG: tRNA (adenosine(37)-N6)-dimethylallyltransferase MiaA [Pseudomonadota bacterium]|nr:tRNA (adenosine(37)-N6)-dimethylallyltransferase MiaA [Pseudomonadota bacterium]
MNVSLDLDYISILGPTCSGKTQLALMLSHHLPIEVISVDSVSVYKGLDIGSAKPSKEEMGIVPHHLIDICELTEVFTVGQFVERANTLIGQIKARGKLPVFCGGSIMYMRAFQENYQNLPVISSTVQKNIDDVLRDVGVGALYEMLCQEDPIMAKKLHPNDKQRIARALAVKRECGQSLSYYWSQQSSTPEFKGHDFLLMVDNRDKHRKRLADRVDHMLAQGLEEECERVLSRYGESIVEHPALRSIGYKEIMQHLCKKRATKNVRDKIIIASSQFVKRQMTWLKSWPNANSSQFCLYDDNPALSDIANSIVETVNR